MKSKLVLPIRKSILFVSFLLASLMVIGQNNTPGDLFFNEDFFFPAESVHLYVPDHGDPLGLWKKSDLKVSFDYHNGNNYGRLDSYYSNKSIQFKAGYSPVSNIYTTASLFRYEGNGFMAVNYEEKMMMGDVGVGAYYAKMDSLSSRFSIFKKDRKWMMDKGVLVNGLLGYSQAQMSSQRSWGIGQGEFNFNRIYGQLGLHLQRSIWGISANIKFGMVNYYKSSLNGHAADDLKPLSNLLMEQNKFFFLESAFRVYLGTRYGQVYFNLVHAESNASFEDYMLKDYKSVGVVLDIEGFLKKNKN